MSNDTDMPTQGEFDRLSLAAKIVYLPRGFSHDSDRDFINEIGVAGLFTAQCGVQIGMGEAASIEQVDELLNQVGHEFGLGIKPSVALQVAEHLPKYAAEHDRLLQSGSTVVEAIVMGVANTYLAHIREMGIPDSQENQLLQLTTDSCNETMRLTLQHVEEHVATIQHPARRPKPPVDDSVRVMTLEFDEPEVPIPEPPPKPPPTDDNNPLVLSVQAGDVEATKMFLAQGWSDCAAFKDGSLTQYAIDNNFDDVAEALKSWRS